MSSTAKHGAVTVVQRMLNRAVENEYLDRNPIKGMKKPKAKRRDVIYTPQQWAQIQEHTDERLADLLDFLFLTGCRPLEARIVEARHQHDDPIIFPADESKGEHEPRVIYLVPNARSILDRLSKQHPTGPLFRNSLDKPWTKNAVVLRLTRISKKVGFRVIAYGAGHNALTAGVDSTAVGHLMGHKDTTMVHPVYGHLTKNPDFLREQAKRAIATVLNFKGNRRRSPRFLFTDHGVEDAE